MLCIILYAVKFAIIMKTCSVYITVKKSLLIEARLPWDRPQLVPLLLFQGLVCSLLHQSVGLRGNFGPPVRQTTLVVWLQRERLQVSRKHLIAYQEADRKHLVASFKKLEQSSYLDCSAPGCLATCFITKINQDSQSTRQLALIA